MNVTRPMRVVDPRCQPMRVVAPTPPQRGSTKKKNKYTWVRLTWQGSVAAAILLAALAVQSLELPGAEPVMAVLRNSVSYDANAEGALGKLYFARPVDSQSAVAAVADMGPCAPALGSVSRYFDAGQAASLGIAVADDPYARAALPGVVERVETSTGGVTVTLRHINDTLTTYGPLEAALVGEGGDVQKASPLGVVAAVGGKRVLDFGVQYRGQAIDPLALLTAAQE